MELGADVSLERQDGLVEVTADDDQTRRHAPVADAPANRKAVAHVGEIAQHFGRPCRIHVHLRIHDLRSHDPAELTAPAAMSAPTNRLYFGNLDVNFTQPDLEQECRRFGQTTSVWVARNPPGFAFVVRAPRHAHAQCCADPLPVGPRRLTSARLSQEFANIRDAEDACKALHDVKLGSQHVRVEFSKNKVTMQQWASQPSAAPRHPAAISSTPHSLLRRRGIWSLQRLRTAG